MLFPLLSVCRDKCFPNECFYLLLRALYMFFYIIALFLVILCFASELSLSLVSLLLIGHSLFVYNPGTSLTAVVSDNQWCFCFRLLKSCFHWISW